MIVNVAPLLKEPVGAQAEYHVAESPIDPHGDNSGLLEAGAVSIDADITATHTNPGAYLEGAADAVAGHVLEDRQRLQEVVAAPPGAGGGEQPACFVRLDS